LDARAVKLREVPVNATQTFLGQQTKLLRPIIEPIIKPAKPAFKQSTVEEFGLSPSDAKPVILNEQDHINQNIQSAALQRQYHFSNQSFKRSVLYKLND
jgi:hypothetical protein